eukprot:2397868-Amphidinium_carterae.1
MSPALALGAISTIRLIEKVMSEITIRSQRSASRFSLGTKSLKRKRDKRKCQFRHHPPRGAAQVRRS